MTPDSDLNGCAAGDGWTQLTTEQVEAMFPADPDLFHSPEGETREVRRLRAAARARRDELDRKYPGLRVS